MKSLSYALIRALAAIIAGVIMVLYPSDAGTYFIIAIGAMFMLPSLITIVGYYLNRSKYSLLFPIGSIGGVLFGLMLMIAPQFFAGFLTIMLGFIIVMGSIQQLQTLLAAKAYAHVPFGYFVLPSLILLLGLLAIFNPMGSARTVVIIIGVCSLVYGLFELVSYFRFTRHRPVINATGMTNAGKTSSKVLDDENIQDAEIIEETPLESDGED